MGNQKKDSRNTHFKSESPAENAKKVAARTGTVAYREWKEMQANAEKRYGMPTPAAKLAEARRGLAIDIVQRSKELAALSVRAALLSESKISRDINRCVNILMKNVQHPGVSK